MITDNLDKLGNQLIGAEYAPGPDSKLTITNEPMTPDEAIEFLIQSVGVKHSILQSTLYNPQLEERIL